MVCGVRDLDTYAAAVDVLARDLQEFRDWERLIKTEKPDCKEHLEIGRSLWLLIQKAQAIVNATFEKADSQLGRSAGESERMFLYLAEKGRQKCGGEGIDRGADASRND